MNAPATPAQLRAPITADRAALERELAARISGEVRFDAGSRAAYASDASNYRQAPIGVVLPRNVEDIIAALEVCRRFDVPLLMRGGGTSQNGQTVNVAVVIDTSKYMNRVLDIDAPAGVVAELERQTAINEDVIRFMTVRVDEHEAGPSVMMRKNDRERTRRREREGE